MIEKKRKLKNRSVLTVFLLTVFTETFIYFIIGLLIYCINYSVNSLFTRSIVTHESNFQRVLESTLSILVLRLFFLELVVKFFILFFSLRKIYEFTFSIISIMIFITLASYYYDYRLDFSDFTSHIRGWSLHLFLAIFFVSGFKLLRFKNW